MTSTFKTFVKELTSNKLTLDQKLFRVSSLEESFERSQFDSVLTKVLAGVMKSTRRGEVGKQGLLEMKTQANTNFVPIPRLIEMRPGKHPFKARDENAYSSEDQLLSSIHSFASNPVRGATKDDREMGNHTFDMLHRKHKEQQRDSSKSSQRNT